MCWMNGVHYAVRPSLFMTPPDWFAIIRNTSNQCVNAWPIQYRRAPVFGMYYFIVLIEAETGNGKFIDMAKTI